MWNAVGDGAQRRHSPTAVTRVLCIAEKVSGEILSRLKLEGTPPSHQPPNPHILNPKVVVAMPYGSVRFCNGSTSTKNMYIWSDLRSYIVPCRYRLHDVQTLLLHALQQEFHEAASAAGALIAVCR